jgi:SAM-dependent methyltransferase
LEESEQVTQSAAYLATLLEILACPIDPASPVTPIRGSDGQVVALRSQNGEYPVVDNVPRMIPPLLAGTDRNQALWQEHQQQRWQDYQEGKRSFFSEGDEKTQYIGEIIAQTGGGLFLDVGCGVLPSPGYMAASGSDVNWIGIDPLLGDVARRFPFAQAVGEYLPFRDHTFDGVLYSSTIYYQTDPPRSLERARRVIRPRGKLYIWYESARLDGRYIVWKIRQMLGRPCHYSELARWAFTRNSLRSMLKQTGFAVEEEVPLCVKCPDYATCRRPAHFLVIAR